MYSLQQAAEILTSIYLWLSAAHENDIAILKPSTRLSSSVHLWFILSGNQALSMIHISSQFVFWICNIWPFCCDWSLKLVFAVLQQTFKNKLFWFHSMLPWATAVDKLSTLANPTQNSQGVNSSYSVCFILAWLDQCDIYHQILKRFLAFSIATVSPSSANLLGSNHAVKPVKISYSVELIQNKRLYYCKL